MFHLEVDTLTISMNINRYAKITTKEQLGILQAMLLPVAKLPAMYNISLKSMRDHIACA